MTETSSDKSASSGRGGTSRSLFSQLELDLRLLGMIGAFLLICVLFNILTGGQFLTPSGVQLPRVDDSWTVFWNGWQYLHTEDPSTGPINTTDGRADPEGTGYTTKSQRRCRGHFCVHYVTSTSDRASSAWVDKTLKVMKKVWKREVGDLGYRAPLSDGALPSSRNGGNGKFDVYLADVGDDLLYGYCSADFVLRKDRTRAGGYCVLDNDFSKDQYGGKPGKTLAVTAAHEFFHAIQFGYDYYEDRWFMESTATWVEERFADGVNDNRQYLAFGQVGEPDTSLDLFERGGFAHYGNWPFWEHLSERYGDAIVRRTWNIRSSWCWAAGGHDGPGSGPVVADWRVILSQGGSGRCSRGPPVGSPGPIRVIPRSRTIPVHLLPSDEKNTCPTPP